MSLKMLNNAVDSFSYKLKMKNTCRTYVESEIHIENPKCSLFSSIDFKTITV